MIITKKIYTHVCWIKMSSFSDGCEYCTVLVDIPEVRDGHHERRQQSSGDRCGTVDPRIVVKMREQRRPDGEERIEASARH